jgi:hypothetical protein
MLTVIDPYGPSDRIEVVYYGDSGEVVDAIVDYVADMQRDITRRFPSEASDPSGLTRFAIERLQRIAGAMRLAYVPPTAAAPPTTLPEA